jgi:hypothetical protein
MQKTTRERAWQSLIRKEWLTIKTEDKLETVERIARAQEYKSKLISNKISEDA